MSASRKEDARVKETRISVARAKVKPKYRTSAAALLEKCRAFYEDPENEKAFREWKEAQKKGA